MDSYIKSLGIKDMNFTETEESMHTDIMSVSYTHLQKYLTDERRKQDGQTMPDTVNDEFLFS